ncbi:hypothetical protein BC358_01175 [Hydrogenophaga sp. H7]|nr:hypothetical protein BC358_01175 [Hydrogenophaga sp. H7]
MTALASHAQSTPATAPAAAAAPSPAKKELIQRVLKLQQGGIERLATAMTEEPALLLADRASEIIAAKVPKDRQETVAKEVQSELQKYLKDTVPLVRRSAQQLAPATIGAVLESKFNEDELREIVAMLESPAYGKYQQLSGEMQQSLQAKLVSDTRATVEPRVQALEKTLGERLKAATSAAAATPAKPAAKPAAK